MTSAFNTASNLLPEFSNRLFVQAECSRVEVVSDLVQQYKVGAVYTLDARRRKHLAEDAGSAVLHTRIYAPEVDLLLDANRYSGRNRKFAGPATPLDPNPLLGEKGKIAGVTEPLDPAWIAFQRKLQLPYALTDSGYIAAGDTQGLVATLTQGAKLGRNVITALPAASKWLTHDADQLCVQIEKFGIPVALMLEDSGDPFDKKNAVDGFIDTIATGVPIVLLRTDTSALGALAHGAAAAAIGVTSALRHFYPIKDGGPDPTEDYLAFIIPQLLRYVRNVHFEEAYIADPTHSAWICNCVYCGGSAMTWIGNASPAEAATPVPLQLTLDDSAPTAPDNDKRDYREEAAFAHSVAAIAELRARLEALAANIDGGLPAAWSQMCENAQQAHYTIQITDEKTWEPRAALAYWR